MARYLFVLPDVAGSADVRLDTDEEDDSPATVYPAGGGTAIAGGRLNADRDGHLPRVTATVDTLWLKTLDYQGSPSGDPVELTGIDEQAAPSPAPPVDAADVVYDPETSELTAEDVQAALDELKALIDAQAVTIADHETRIAALEAP